MMSDLTDRLREGRSKDSPHRWTVTDIHREAADEIDRLSADLKAAREALRPFAAFVTAYDRNPLRLDDEFYAIHVGTDHEASLRLSDCRKASATLSDGG